MSNRFIELRDALLRNREDLAGAQQAFRWPEFERIQLGARLLRCDCRRQRRAGAASGR